MANDLLTPDEIKWLWDSGQFKTSDDIKKLQGPEIAALNQLIAERNKGKDPTSQRRDSWIASGVPIVGNVSPEDVLVAGQIGPWAGRTALRAARGFASGVKDGGFWRGIGTSLESLLGTGAAEKGALGAAQGAPRIGNMSRQMPMSEAEYEALAGHPRGIFEMPNGNGGPPSLGSRDTAGLRSQSNVSLRRTPADVTEQVTGSSRNGYEDPRGWNTANEPQPGEVEQIQKQIASELDKTKKVRRRSPK